MLDLNVPEGPDGERDTMAGLGRITTTAALALLLAGPAAAVSLTREYSSFWVLGDSLSDPGNLYRATEGAEPPSPPYDRGRFSSGPVWAEGIAADFTRFGRPTGNTAFGGATAVTNDDAIPDLDAQLGLFSQAYAGRGGDRPVAALWFGANDIFASVPGGEAERAGRRAAGAVADGLRQLSSAGVDDFIVFNLPDLGRTPSYALFQPDLAAEATSGAKAFNARLAASLPKLRKSGATVTEINAFAILNAMIDDPQRFGVSDAARPCLYPSAGAAAAFGDPQACSGATIAERLFFDGVHPNGVIHAGIGDIVETEVAPVPLPATAWLLLLGLAALALKGRVQPLTRGSLSFLCSWRAKRSVMPAM